ncbi:deoxyribose-phosphate aldolase [Granulicoccus phenolivorans]|uniref:deoxyribose-phosphate aldolase n=1 Tax=Granulicoccus phenolivorans TaxID=266854 RepID=UPI00042498C9|nr:deoxyribose-phosphate aldolase [Granulicoccus phenolivorans]
MAAMSLSRRELALVIDHTLLKPEATRAQVEALAAEARELGTYAICVSPSMLAADRPLELGPVRLATVAGFPSGQHHAAIKAAEAARAVADGADEVDVVLNFGLLKAGDLAGVAAELSAVRRATGTAVLKVIIEAAALTGAEIREACAIAVTTGADFVKTSTGFHPAGGATPEAVALMRSCVGDGLGVKASGGIRDYATAVRMIEAGATRLGLSGSRAVLAGAPA